MSTIGFVRNVVLFWERAQGYLNRMVSAKLASILKRKKY